MLIDINIHVHRAHQILLTGIGHYPDFLQLQVQFGSQAEVPELQIFTGIIKLFPRLSIFLLIVFKLFLFHYGYKLIELNTHTHTQYTSYKEFRNGMSTQDWRTIPIIYAMNFRLKILISNHREVSILTSLYQYLHRVCTVRG